MQKTIAVMAILSAALIAFGAEKFVVEDGSSGGNQATCGGWWYTYNDASTGGNSAVTPEPGKFMKAKDGGVYSAKMKGRAGNKLGWDYVGMGVTLGSQSGCPGDAAPVNLTKYSTLTFKIKGSLSGGRLTIIIPYTANRCDEISNDTKTLTNWADYETAVQAKLSKDWTMVKLYLRKDFKQPRWAKKMVPVEDVLRNAHVINWHFSSPDGDTVDIAVTDVECN
jgi:hypothetical protein